MDRHCSGRAQIGEARLLFGPELSLTSSPRWKIREAHLESAIQFALDDDKAPKQQMGPVRFYFYYRFFWPDFERRPYWASEMETRKRNSDLGITLGARRLFLQPNFVFPAPWTSEFLRNFITEVEQAVPFRFRDQYFQRCLPAKKGPHGRYLNLPNGWRSAKASAWSTT